MSLSSAEYGPTVASVGSERPGEFMRLDLAPLLFDDGEREAAEAARRSVVAPAEVSPAARSKARDKHNAGGDPVHSFRVLLGDLATITLNTVQPRLPDATPSKVVARPTALQAKAIQLLGVRL